MRERRIFLDTYFIVKCQPCRDVIRECPSQVPSAVHAFSAPLLRTPSENVLCSMEPKSLQSPIEVSTRFIRGNPRRSDPTKWPTFLIGQPSAPLYLKWHLQVQSTLYPLLGQLERDSAEEKGTSLTLGS